MELDAKPTWWFEDGGDPPYSSLREVLHVIVETAPYAGHLDICRELADGGQHLVLDQPTKLPHPWPRLIGSRSVVGELAATNLIDEYRMLTFPTAVGSGGRLFTDSRLLTVVSAEQVGPAVPSILTTREA